MDFRASVRLYLWAKFQDFLNSEGGEINTVTKWPLETMKQISAPQNNEKSAGFRIVAGSEGRFSSMKSSGKNSKLFKVIKNMCQKKYSVISARYIFN